MSYMHEYLVKIQISFYEITNPLWYYCAFCVNTVIARFLRFSLRIKCNLFQTAGDMNGSRL